MSSVLEELRSLEQRLVDRLEELQPLVDEYEELQRLADRLGVSVPRAGAAAAAPEPRPTPRSRATPPARRRSRGGTASRSRPGGTQATGRERRARVLDLISAQPGITVPDISRAIGVEPPSVYRIVRRLQEEGAITKQGKSLELA
jgi:hypothetical protein